MRILTLTIGIVIGIMNLSGCTGAKQEPGADDLRRAETLRPHDVQLAERYERSCMACHAVHNSGAPLTGFAPHWRPRLDQGIEKLVQHAYEGFNAMPARGLCNDCTQEDMRALIGFMSNRKPA